MLTFEERVLCGNPLQRSGSGSEPDPEPNWEFGPVVNTSYGPTWPGYDLHQGGYGGSQMFPPPQLPSQEPSS